LAVVQQVEQTPIAQVLLQDKLAVLAAGDRLVILPMRQVKTPVLGLRDKALQVAGARHEHQALLILLVVVAVLVGQVPQAQPTTIQVAQEHSLAESLATVVMVGNCLLAVLLQLMAAAAAAVWVELAQLIQQPPELAALAVAATEAWLPLELLAAPTLVVAEAVPVSMAIHLPILVVEPAAAAS
jgi:hypothetical protein